MPHCLVKGWRESSRWISFSDFTAHGRVQVGASREQLGTRLEAPVIGCTWEREKVPATGVGRFQE